MPAPLAPFSLPDRYRLEGGIAAGGMAAVYAAHDTVLDRPVAVKVLAEHLNADGDARRRFQREARAAAAVSSHPAVVTIFDVGEHEGRSFIVMERRTGGSLGDEIAAGAVEPRRALGWLEATADALDAAHARGIVHRDIKPGNLLLDEHDKVAVADFGIARLAYETDRFTQTGQVLGTAAYLSPEQATGESATAASDRYALAAVAFELLTGRKPFVASHFAAQARAHIEDPIPAASSLNPRLPRSVDAVLRRGMAKDPEDRWTTASAFVAALRNALDDAPEDTTRAMTPQPRRAPAAPPPRAPRTPLPPAARPPRRFPGAIVAALALLLVAGVAVAIALTGGDGGSDQPRATPTPTATATATAKAQRTPSATATATSTPEATATPEPTPTPTPTPESTPEPTQTPATTPTGDDPAQLNDAGFRLFQAGDYARAIPFFQRAVQACGGSTQVACAYATYNLGAALNRSGDPAAAIPLLQRRLQAWPDNQRATVRKELRSACRAAGQDCG